MRSSLEEKLAVRLAEYDSTPVCSGDRQREMPVEAGQARIRQDAPRPSMTFRPNSHEQPPNGEKDAPRPEPVGAAIVAKVCRRIWLGRIEPNTVGSAQTQGAALEK